MDQRRPLDELTANLRAFYKAADAHIKAADAAIRETGELIRRSREAIALSRDRLAKKDASGPVEQSDDTPPLALGLQSPTFPKIGQTGLVKGSPGESARPAKRFEEP